MRHIYFSLISSFHGPCIYFFHFSNIWGYFSKSDVFLVSQLGQNSWEWLYLSWAKKRKDNSYFLKSHLKFFLEQNKELQKSKYINTVLILSIFFFLTQTFPKFSSCRVLKLFRAQFSSALLPSLICFHNMVPHHNVRIKLHKNVGGRKEGNGRQRE